MIELALTLLFIGCVFLAAGLFFLNDRYWSLKSLFDAQWRELKRIDKRIYDLTIKDNKDE